MEKKWQRSSFFGQAVAWAFLFMVLAALLGPAQAAELPAAAATSSFALIQPEQPLSLETRLACRTAVEEVYWQSRTWPAENPSPKPPLSQVMPAAVIEAKVADSLAQSQALAEWGQQPVTPALLQAEINRQAANSQQPEILGDIWAALDNNPVLVAECLARPALADRLLRERFEQDERLAGSDFATWWAAAKDDFAFEANTPAGNYYLPPLNRVILQDDTWQDTAAIPSQVRGRGVWTGSEMLYLGESVTQGYRYNPATDTWQTMTTINAPHRVSGFTAVWSGTEMITWGGCTGGHEFCTTSAGGRYNPATDSWTATTMSGAPGPRRYHGAVWSGTEMLVWGGCTEDSNGNQNCNIVYNDGGRYNPATNSWQPVTTANAPAGRRQPTLVWTDDEMILWSGASASSPGGRYNPTTNTWQTINTFNAPAGTAASLVWTGSEVIAWGGCTGTPFCTTAFNTGGRYNPTSNSWTPTTMSSAPSPRWGHRAIWTGAEMIVWGGYNGSSYLNTGGRYNPTTDTWVATGTLNAPAGRSDQQMFWTGNLVLVWGGNGTGAYNETRNGGRYDPASDSWTPISDKDPYSFRYFHTAIWTGVEMIAWGGIGDGIVGGLDTGRVYDPVIDAWSETSVANAPSLRSSHTAIWTGTEMIIWGGNTVSWQTAGTGGRYNPMTDTWTATSINGAPDAPALHSAVWTGTEMIVWGGSIWNYPWSNGGGRYNPATDSWAPVTLTGAPQGRYLHSAVWSGEKMVIWGGAGSTGMLGDGALYNPASNTWSAMNLTNAPVERALHTTIWTGNEMIVWGGWADYSPIILLNDGGRYNPATNTWTPISITGAPAAAARHSAVWTGDEMIVWSGCIDTASCLDNGESGGRYNPQTDTWTATTMTNVPDGRQFYSAVWTGNEMIVWGGETDHNGYTNTGGRYYAMTSGNNAPQAFNDTYAVETGNTLTIPAPGVLANDDDPDGDPLTAVLVSGPANGTLALNADGSFTYTPDAGFNGADNFTYQASDGSKVSNVAVVGITVNAPNNAPVTVDDSYMVDEDALLSVAAPGVLANDNDPDGDPLTAVLVSGPANGSLTLNADGSFTYQPNPNFNGQDSFTYQATDGALPGNVATVTITINPVAEPPQFFIFLPIVQRP
ncbi:MAG: Ig-like domain-containing protein [Chloroflexi bacterium]|nr:Ig-like domain-containing protein [Chloroflexota bacterium]